MPIQAENVGDIVADTLKDLGKPKFTDISSNIQRHVAMKKLLHENRVVIESGYAFQFDVLVQQSNAARTVPLGATDQLDDVDGMVQGSSVWRHITTSYQLVRQLIAMNREPARIVDYVKQKRIMALISATELFETLFWSAPVSSDSLTPFGLPYCVTKNGTAGFNGGALAGYTSIYGLSPTTYPGWNNYTYPYTAVSRDDFIRASRKAATLTDWEPPVDGIPQPNTGDEYGFYTNYGVIGPLEEALESQNDNLGDDIASMDGKVMFRRVPVIWVPWLERDTTNPFYGINWGWYKTYILRDEWAKETAVPILPHQHTVHGQFIDWSLQWIGKNRRVHMVGSNGYTYPG